MKKRGFRGRMVRAATAALIGGSLLQLGSCDPTVRATLLTGLESTSSTLVQTFVTAFFTSLQDDTTDTVLTTT